MTERHETTGGAQHYASEVPWSQAPLPIWPFRSADELRAYVADIVREVLEEDARAIREGKAFQPVKTE